MTESQENIAEQNSFKDIFELSDDDIGNVAFMEVDWEEQNSQKAASEANLSQDIFLSDKEDAVSNTSIDIFDDCESCSCFDNDVTIKPIGKGLVY